MIKIIYNIEEKERCDMPFINIKTNVGITKEKEESIKNSIGTAINTLGKTENWLMMNFEDEQRMYFSGNSNLPLAFIQVDLFGSADRVRYNEFTGKITELINKELGVSPNNVYVKYSETNNWGWNGSNF